MKDRQNRLVVADAGWAKDIPEWILEEIKNERIINGMIGIMTGKEEVGDAEVLAYLFTACMRSPVSHEFGEIYIYLAGKVMMKIQRIKEEDLPDCMKEKQKQGLTEDEKSELNILKQFLYKSRGGEIKTPLLDVLREMKKMKGGKK